MSVQAFEKSFYGFGLFRNLVEVGFLRDDIILEGSKRVNRDI